MSPTPPEGMTATRSDLPRFRRPPVVETVMGVHFELQERFNVAERALFWNTIREDFPTVEEKSPVDEVREEFGDSKTRALGIQWKVSEAPPAVRLWAKSSNGRHTIQIQRDALLVNWEHDASRPDQYWPYQGRRSEFGIRLNSLNEFMLQQEIGSVRPSTCFAKYINHVEYEGANFATLLHQLFVAWNNQTSDGWLPEIEHGDLQFAYRMPNDCGRLHVRATPAVRRADKHPFLRLELTARGSPRDPTISAALDWLDLGHEWIVRGFASMTRPEMHARWEREQ